MICGGFRGLQFQALHFHISLLYGLYGETSRRPCQWCVMSRQVSSSLQNLGSISLKLGCLSPQIPEKNNLILAMKERTVGILVIVTGLEAQMRKKEPFPISIHRSQVWPARWQPNVLVWVGGGDKEKTVSKSRLRLLCPQPRSSRPSLSTENNKFVGTEIEIQVCAFVRFRACHWALLF